MLPFSTVEGAIAPPDVEIGCLSIGSLRSAQGFAAHIPSNYDRPMSAGEHEAFGASFRLATLPFVSDFFEPLAYSAKIVRYPHLTPSPECSMATWNTTSLGCRELQSLSRDTADVPH